MDGWRLRKDGVWLEYRDGLVWYWAMGRIVGSRPAWELGVGRASDVSVGRSGRDGEEEEEQAGREVDVCYGNEREA
jgi:hypothetical protein